MKAPVWMSRPLNIIGISRIKQQLHLSAAYFCWMEVAIDPVNGDSRTTPPVIKASAFGFETGQFFHFNPKPLCNDLHIREEFPILEICSCKHYMLRLMPAQDDPLHQLPKAGLRVPAQQMSQSAVQLKCRAIDLIQHELEAERQRTRMKTCQFWDRLPIRLLREAKIGRRKVWMRGLVGHATLRRNRSTRGTQEFLVPNQLLDRACASGGHLFQQCLREKAGSFCDGQLYMRARTRIQTMQHFAVHFRTEALIEVVPEPRNHGIRPAMLAPERTISGPGTRPNKIPQITRLWRVGFLMMKINFLSCFLCAYFATENMAASRPVCYIRRSHVAKAVSSAPFCSLFRIHAYGHWNDTAWLRLASVEHGLETHRQLRGPSVCRPIRRFVVWSAAGTVPPRFQYFAGLFPHHCRGHSDFRFARPSGPAVLRRLRPWPGSGNDGDQHDVRPHL